MDSEQDRGQWTSASSAAADSACAGRHAAQKGLADIKSADAEHGTTVHAALAKQDPAGLNIEQVDTYDACMDIEGRMLVKYFGPEVQGLKPNPVREKRYWVQWPDGLRHSGQVDCVHRKGTKALIFEYKTLSGEIPESPKNLQLRDQVVLYDANSQLLTEIGVVVVQPLATWQPEICVYTRSDIEKARNLMYARVKASNAPNALRTPGEAQCKWCRAAKAGTCAEYNKWAGSTAMVKVDLLDTAVNLWTPQMRAAFCERLPIAEKWLADCKAAMKELLKADPEAIPGFELVEGNRNFKVTNAQGIFDGFSKLGGSLEQFMRCIDVGKGKLKTELAAATKQKGKKLDEQLSGIMSGNIVEGRNEPSIKRKE